MGSPQKPAGLPTEGLRDDAVTWQRVAARAGPVTRW
jgi:hypothetical protein